MASSRIRFVLVGISCTAVAFVCTHLILDRLAEWVEVEQGAHLWSEEEWLQLLGEHNFVGRGSGRIMFTGSSEAREGFLPEELEAGLPGFEVYNNSYSNHTLATFLLALRYIEAEFGEEAIPDKIVLGVTPWFLLNDPETQDSYFPEVINRYSPRFRMDLGRDPPGLARKGLLRSMVSRYRFLTHQSKRYRGALRGVLHTGVQAVSPETAERWNLRRRLAPSTYHHRAPISKERQLEQLIAVSRSSADPTERLRALVSEFADLKEFAGRHEVDLYVVNMPQSSVMTEDYFGDTYEAYRDALRSVAADVPFLDLAGFLSDDEFYDLVHADFEGARRISTSVARFVRGEGWSAPADAARLSPGGIQ